MSPEQWWTVYQTLKNLLASLPSTIPVDAQIRTNISTAMLSAKSGLEAALNG